MGDHQQFYEEVGRRIRKSRQDKGLTQEFLAEKVRLSRTSLTNIEKGRQKLLLHTLAAIAQALQIAAASLLPEPTPVPADDLNEALRIRPRAEQKWIKSALTVQEGER